LAGNSIQEIELSIVLSWATTFDPGLVKKHPKDPNPSKKVMYLKKGVSLLLV